MSTVKNRDKGLKRIWFEQYTLLLQAVGWDISSFPNIERWLKECSQLPGAAENDEGAIAFGEAVKKNLK